MGDAKDNFMDFIAVAHEHIQDGDLVVGRVIYENSGITMTENYDYTRKKHFFLFTIKEIVIHKIILKYNQQSQFIFKKSLCNSLEF